MKKRDTKEQAIIVALCRCALAINPTAATKHQVNRLRDHYRDVGNDISSNKIDRVINASDENREDFKIVRSELDKEKEKAEFIQKVFTEFKCNLELAFERKLSFYKTCHPELTYHHCEIQPLDKDGHKLFVVLHFEFEQSELNPARLSELVTAMREAGK